MKNLKELIKRKKFLTLFLSSFIFISGLLIFILGLIMIISTNAINKSASNEAIIPLAVVIFGVILIFIGYIIPKSIIKTIHDEENEQKQQSNEKKYIIQNLHEIKLANDTEKQNYIIEKKWKNTISFPMMLAIGIIFWIGAIFIIVSLIKNETLPFLLFTGICFIIIDIIIFYRNKSKNKNMIQKFMNSNIYIANCYAYDRKTERIKVINNTRHNDYYTLHLIKITDGDYFIEKWFPINHKKFYDEMIYVKLYISDKIDIYDIIVDDKDSPN